jgi:hypothetical protein
MWQPSSERRINRCSAKREFSKLLELFPVPVQVPVQVCCKLLPPGVQQC